MDSMQREYDFESVEIFISGLIENKLQPSIFSNMFRFLEWTSKEESSS